MLGLVGPESITQGFGEGMHVQIAIATLLLRLPYLAEEPLTLGCSRYASTSRCPTRRRKCRKVADASRSERIEHHLETRYILGDIGPRYILVWQTDQERLAVVC